MLKFFRRLRQDVLSEGKTARYFKYALGEIFLVVIGILIALQINNWNVNRLNGIEEKEILQNIKQDLSLELENFKRHLQSQLVFTQSCKEIIEAFNVENRFVISDALLGSLNDLFVRNSFIPNLTTFRTLENTGKLELISNDSLKEQITIHAHDLEIFNENTTNNNTTLVDQLVNQSLLGLSFFQANGFSSQMKQNWDVTDWKVPKIKDRSFFKDHLQSKLDLKDNSLILMNAVNFRLLLANVQLDYTAKLEAQTKQLLNDVTNELEAL